MTTKQKAQLGRVAAYIRVSRERDGMEAPKIYREEVSEWCKRNGYSAPEIFEDLDYSGRKDSKPRPQFLRMIERADDFELIVVPRLDRFGRSIRDAVPVFDDLEKRGVGFVALDVPGLDTTSSSGKLVRDLLVRFAEWQSDQISDSWRAVHRHLKRQGRPSGGNTTPYGYTYDKRARTYRINERQARIVREIFRRAIDGEAIRSITGDLNRRGVKPRTIEYKDGGTRNNADVWIPQTLKGMLSNPAYAGLISVDGELVKATWTPIVKREIFERAHALREASRNGWRDKAKPGRPGEYLLSGLLECSTCEKVLRHHAASGSRPTMYRCETCKGHGIAAHRAEGAVRDAVLDYLRKLMGGDRNVTGPLWQSSIPKENDDSKRLDAQIRDIEAKMDKLVEQSLIVEGPASEAAFKKALSKLEREHRKLSAQRVKSISGAVEHKQTSEVLRKLSKPKTVRGTANVWDSLSRAEQQFTIGLIWLGRIVVEQDYRPKRLRLYPGFEQLAAAAEKIAAQEPKRKPTRSRKRSTKRTTRASSRRATARTA
jgi:site-specific DNA recombinase